MNRLNWTVLRAATSQPNDCSVKTAILFPTFLHVVCQRALTPL